MSRQLIRCPQFDHDPIYIQYHDNEWGQITKHSQKLFELLCLEGQQAGLSWITVLKKRTAYYECFHQFDPHQIANISDQDIALLMQDKRIIRNQLKLLAIIENAKAYLAIEERSSFSDFLWQIVDHQPIINHWGNISQIPSKTELSIQLSKQLKQAGFKFAGSKICYALMQACGMVNDHLINCFCHPSSQI